MKIFWITTSKLQAVDGEYRSNGADARYRILIPAQDLARRGHEIRIKQLIPGTDAQQFADGIHEPIVVLGKLVPPTAPDFGPMGRCALQLVRELQARGKTVIADINDYHFEHAEYGAYFRDVVRLADGVTASTQAMAEAIRKHTHRPVQIVRDPYEGARRMPRAVPAGKPEWQRYLGFRRPVERRLRLLWFGYPGNLDTLAPLVQQLAPVSRRQPMLLQVVTTPGFGATEYCAEINSQRGHDVRAEFLPWSQESVWKLLDECDVVAIPSLTDQARNLVKSPNRLIESLWAGRFVVAHRLPSYLEFDRYAWVGDDLGQGIRWAQRHSAETADRIAQGQEYVAGNYSPTMAADDWERVCAEFAGRKVATSGDSEGGEPGLPVRLNLGCGDKILAGYVNVDIAPSRKGVLPDVLCDLHDLRQFDTGSVDEILAVHVIEHIWYWEVAGVLKEWARVLKPGGRMIIECPNLESACETFLQDPELACGPGKEGEFTMWVFYGDPGWKDPLMCHRWGYTPLSLCRLLERAGLIDVRQQPAQFKMREPRDMRIVGVSPH